MQNHQEANINDKNQCSWLQSPLCKQISFPSKVEISTIKACSQLAWQLGLLVGRQWHRANPRLNSLSAVPQLLRHAAHPMSRQLAPARRSHREGCVTAFQPPAINPLCSASPSRGRSSIEAGGRRSSNVHVRNLPQGHLPLTVTLTQP